MRRNLKHRDIRYTREVGCLVQTVCDEDGHGYVHRCTREVYEQVANHLDGLPLDGPGTSQEAMVRELGMPNTQVNVALEFMKERGCVIVRRRRSFPASRCTFEDAMLEFHALGSDLQLA